MYLWNILSRQDDELIHRVYNTKKVSNSVSDWVRLVNADKDELGIELTNEDIQCVSQEMFKIYVKKKVKVNYLKHLNNLKSEF